MSGWLVVDGNIQTCDNTRRRVNARGLACETAHDWRTAQQRLSGHPFDVIVIGASVPTGDDQSIVEHLASQGIAGEASIILLDDHASSAEGTSQANLVRGTTEMLADIDQLIDRISE